MKVNGWHINYKELGKNDGVKVTLYYTDKNGDVYKVMKTRKRRLVTSFVRSLWHLRESFEIL